MAEQADTATSLGDLAFRVGRWRTAAEAYAVAMDAADDLYAASALASSKQSELGESVGVFMRCAWAWAKAADGDTGSDALAKAVVAVERGRARWLGESLALDHHRDLADVDAANEQAAARFRKAALALRELQDDERGRYRPSGPHGSGRDQADLAGVSRATDEVLTRELRAATDELTEAIGDIRAMGGKFATFLTAPDFETVASAVVPGDALVYLLVSSAGSLALLVHRQEGSADGVATVEAIWCAGFTSDDLQGLLVVLDEQGDVQGGYFAGQVHSQAWLRAALTTALPQLGESLIGPVAARLRSIGAVGVTLVPCNLLGALPLHAATYRRGAQVLRLIDEFDVSYGPSARVLATARSLPPDRQVDPATVAGVGNPMPTSSSSLEFAAAELEGIAALFGSPSPLYREDATRAALIEAAKGARYVHLACHGQYDLLDPLSSRLLLAGEEPLTLREILADRPFGAARLVVASACKTAITDFGGLPDEAMGLPAGFMSAGTPGVIGTLWSVDDLSTALLMLRFYEYHLTGDPAVGEEAMSPARALRRAQCWLSRVTVAELRDFLERHAGYLRVERDMVPDTDGDHARRFSPSNPDPDERPFADPYYWAPFVFAGA